MPTNLIPQCNPTSGTSGGVTYTWASDDSYVRCVGTTTLTLSVSNIVPSAGNISNTPFRAGHTYHLDYPNPNSAITIQCYCYPQTSGTYDARFLMSSSQDFTIPDPCVRLTLRVRVANNSTVNTTIYPSIYDITFTDVDADIKAMNDYLGYYNSWFNANAWSKFTSLPWDGESCSEIACSISYFYGNISKIYVSNYAQGLVDLFRANGRFYTRAQGGQRGDFIWFDYDHDGIADHSGRIMSIDPDGTIHTFEGNVYSVTATFPYSPNDPTILGFGRPNYDYDPGDNPSPVPPTFTYCPYYRHMRRLRGNLL